MDQTYVINPDIHGRDFWKQTTDFNGKIIFLGDYIDPYPSEHISKEMALENFKEILEFKKANPEKVVLLYGNHDGGYFSADICTCRRDIDNYKEIQKLFLDNWDLFDIFYIFTLKDKIFICSHAGIQDEWIDTFYPAETSQKQLELLSNEFKNVLKQKDHFVRAMSEVSFWRGGDSDKSSIVWRDAYESLSARFGFQLFGHSLNRLQQNSMGVCLDLRQPLVIKADKIETLDGDELFTI